MPGELEALGRALDGVEYPGRAWPVRRRRRIVYSLLGIASAAAAILVLALALRGTPDAPKVAPERRVASTTTQTTIPLVRTEEPLFRFDIPTDIEPTMAGQVNLVPPAASWPPITNISPSVSVDWQLPTLSGLWIE